MNHDWPTADATSACVESCFFDRELERFTAGLDWNQRELLLDERRYF